MSSYADEGEYKGYPVILIYTGRTLKNGDKEFVSLGVRKAGAVCEQIDNIRRFVDKHEHPKGR